MNTKTLFTLWGGLFALCAGLGFIPNPTGALKILLILAAIAFFVPPLILIRKGGKKTRQLIGSLSLLSLCLTTFLIILNFLSVGFSAAVGNALYALLIIISSPMICGQVWVLSLFGWAWLLFDSRAKR